MTSSFSINTYRQATAPIRSMLRSRYQAECQFPISVLYYHRVADWQPTPWTITRADFRRHLDWLQSHLEVISLDEAIARLESGQSGRPAAVITFDDGYSDNMDFAVPLMMQRKVPFTYYVSTHQVINQQPFQHDQEFPRPLYPNSIRDLKKLVRWGVDIGAHTCHHVDLAKVTDEEQLKNELQGCRRQLMNVLGCDVKHFAFPFGQRDNISAQSVQFAREAGFKSVAGAYGGYNFVGQNPFFIQRFHGDPLLARVQNWMTYDPRFLGVAPNSEWLDAIATETVIPAPIAPGTSATSLPMVPPAIR